MSRFATFRQDRRPDPAHQLTLVHHNSLGSWDVFLSLFGSFVGAPRVEIVLLQDPPSSRGFLPPFTAFKSFSPSLPRLKVACHVSLDFLSRYPTLPGFYDGFPDAMYLDVHTPDRCFGTSAPKFSISNVYARERSYHTRSIPPEVAFQQLDLPYLVAGDFNIHNPATDPSRIFSYSEELTFSPFHDLVADLGFRLLNTPGVYTRFPPSGSHRPGVIDLAFANPQMSPAFSAWDASTLPSTGSDHVTILITLAPLDTKPLPKVPHWDSTDWVPLTPRLEVFRVPPAPPRPSPAQLDEWFSASLNTLTSMLLEFTPLSSPSPRSQP